MTLPCAFHDIIFMTIITGHYGRPRHINLTIKKMLVSCLKCYFQFKGQYSPKKITSDCVVKEFNHPSQNGRDSIARIQQKSSKTFSYKMGHAMRLNKDILES